MNFVVRLVPGATSPYSQNGVSAEMPRSHTSPTSTPPVIWGTVSSSAVSGPLLRMTSVKVTRVPCAAEALFALIETTPRSAVGGPAI